MTNTIESSYDEQLYHGNSFSQSHPDRLATIAQLHGLTPPDIKICKVLELGCAIGSNLIPMAEQLPDAQFIGIDISEKQITHAQSIAREIGLNNIRFKKLSILDIDADFGEFDYIIAHGLFSWVPPEVQNKTFSILQNNLTPNGVAYISYNTYPGWHMKDIARNMMQFHVEQIEHQEQKVTEARSLINSVAELLSQKNSAYALSVKEESDFINDAADWYIAHDHLEINNHPIYFHDFIKRASAHRLHYLDDAIIASANINNAEKEAQHFLKSLSNDEIRIQQYLDFVNNRSFRQSLLCKKEKPAHAFVPEVIEKLFVAASAVPDSNCDSQQLNSETQFRFPRGETITTANPIIKATLLLLYDNWPQAIAFPEIVKHVCATYESFENAPNKGLIAQQLIKLFQDGYGAGLIELRTTPVPCSLLTGEYPTASKVARHQSLTSEKVTNLRHEPVSLNGTDRQLLQLLDGKHSQQDLLNIVERAAIHGSLTFELDGNRITETTQLKQMAREHLDTSLNRLSKLALLFNTDI